MVKQIPCGLFVTGTDTGVGKTQVAALAHLLADRNLIVRPRKPVESGCRRRKRERNSDSALNVSEEP